VCLDEVVRDGKKMGSPRLARQGQLGGLQLARNSRASVPSPENALVESLAWQNINHILTTVNQQRRKFALKNEGEREREIHARQIKRG